MLCEPGGELGCSAKAGQLVECGRQRGRLVRRAEAGARLSGGVNGDGSGWTSGSERWLRGGCGCCPCTRVTVAASERGRGEGGASAVEAGQSCSRHQGRHFLSHIALQFVCVCFCVSIGSVCLCVYSDRPRQQTPRHRLDHSQAGRQNTARQSDWQKRGKRVSE